MRKVGQYVGVTGFMTRNEVEAAIDMIPRSSPQRLMVGVLASSKTLRGENNKWPGRYPKKESIRDLFIDDQRVMNLIHYSTDDTSTLYEQLVEMTQLTGPYLDGFQLNLCWPPICQIEKYRQENFEKFLLLQIGSRAMEVVGNLERLAEFIGVYSPVIDAILVDASGGNGVRLDPVKGAEYLRVALGYRHIGLGIAGGLGPLSLDLISDLVRQFPLLSIDAEGALRVPKTDALSIEAMRAYLWKAFRVLSGWE